MTRKTEKKDKKSKWNLQRNILPEIKTPLNRIQSRLDTTENDEFENAATDTAQSEIYLIKMKKHISGSWNETEQAHMPMNRGQETGGMEIR